MRNKYPKIRNGDRFGQWIIIETNITRINKIFYHKCQCNCQLQTIKNVSDTSLKNGGSKSCGCRIPIIPGDKFGRWVVIKRTNNRNNNSPYYECECQCSAKTIREVFGSDLRRRHSLSCGCLDHSNYAQTQEQATQLIIRNTYKTQIRYNNKRELDVYLSLGEYSLLIQENCCYSDIPPNKYLSIPNNRSDFTKKFGKIRGHTIDRINSNISYQFGNVVSCEQFINCGKNDKSYENFIQWIDNIKCIERPVLFEDLQYIIQYDIKNIQLIYPLKNKQNQNFIIYKINKFRNHKKESQKELNLTDEQIFNLKISPCILCGHQPNISILQQEFISSGTLKHFLNEIDRWDNSIHYTIDNCTTLCRHCNCFKNTLIKHNSMKNTIKRLINKIENGQIIDYFTELPKLKIKLES